MKGKVLIILVSLIFLVSCARTDELAAPRESSMFRRAEVEHCRITADSLEVKAGAGNKFPTITTLKKDDEVRVLGQIDDWYVIRLDNNRIGCIDSTQTQPIVKDKGQPQQPQPAPAPEQPQQPQQPTQPEEPEPTQPPTDAGGETNQNLATMEREMIKLVNQERRKNNLQALATDPELTRIARIKAQDMVENNYFSHYSPNYGSPFDMMDSFGIEYLTAAENLAANATVEKAHNSLMNSSGHRQNILNPNFTHIGVGVKPSQKYGYIFVQMFIGKPE